MKFLSGVRALSLAGACLLVLTGCGGDSEVSRPGGAKSEAVVSLGTAEAPREVKLEAGDAMKFSLPSIEARAGETLRLVLVNTGSAPKEAMGHNWVLLKTGVDPVSYANDAAKARGADYIPVERAADVIAHTKLLGGGARDSVVFVVPSVSGDYPFLCTFPAHFQLGMKGSLVVR